MLKLHKEEGVTYTSCIIFFNIVQATITGHKSNGPSKSLHIFGYLFIVYCLQFYVCLGPESPLDKR
jgi:hypothetical protein